MPWTPSRRSLAILQSSGSPTSSGTMWVAESITGRPAAVRTCLVRVAWRCCASRTVCQPFALGDAAAARSVHADGMDLVDIGHSVVALGKIDDLLDRRDVTIHRIDALEDDQLGAFAASRLQQAFKMRNVVVAKDLLLGARTPHALDHRGVV